MAYHSAQTEQLFAPRLGHGTGTLAQQAEPHRSRSVPTKASPRPLTAFLALREAGYRPGALPDP